MTDIRQQNRPPLVLPCVRERAGAKSNIHLTNRLGAARAPAAQNRDRAGGRTMTAPDRLRLARGAAALHARGPGVIADALAELLARVGGGAALFAILAEAERRPPTPARTPRKAKRGARV